MKTPRLSELHKKINLNIPPTLIHPFSRYGSMSSLVFITSVKPPLTLDSSACPSKVVQTKVKIIE